MKSNFKLLMVGVSIASTSLIFTGCGNSDTETSENEGIKDKIDQGVKDGGDGQQISIGGQLFSIPSPVQTAFLIKEVGTEFNSEVLNPVENVNNYSSSFLKALNLGVYGADLGYLTIYENNPEALKYLAATKKMADQLDLGNAFDKELMDRFEASSTNKDSILVLVSEAFKKSDVYLKENDKHDVAALVLAGGWLEAMYFATKSATETNDPRVIERIGDQKNALESLIKMLGQYGNDEEYSDLAYELEDLYEIFKSIKYTYEYVPPTHDEGNKVTTINCKHNVELADADLATIIEKIESIRNEIVL